jgi:hypothetical protein
VTEGVPFATLTIKKSILAKSYSKLEVKTSNGTALAGSDYTTVDVILVWANAEMSKTVNIPILNDTTVEPTEAFTVTLIGRRNATAGLPVQVTILNDDSAAPQWVPAPLVNDGYARCKTAGGCHSIASPCPPLINTTGPIYCSYPDIIAQQGDVRLQAWNGIAAFPNNRIVAALWPVGHDPRVTISADDWKLGVEGWQDEWEGVIPAQ